MLSAHPSRRAAPAAPVMPTVIAPAAQAAGAGFDAGPEDLPAGRNRMSCLALATTLVRQFVRSAASFGLGRWAIRPLFADARHGELASGCYIGVSYCLLNKLFLLGEQYAGLRTLSLPVPQRAQFERAVRVTLIGAFALKTQLEHDAGLEQQPQSVAVTGATGAIDVALVLLAVNCVRDLVLRPAVAAQMNLAETGKLVLAGAAMGAAGAYAQPLQRAALESALRLGTWMAVQEIVILAGAVCQRLRIHPQPAAPLPARVASLGGDDREVSAHERELDLLPVRVHVASPRRDSPRSDSA